MNYHLSMRLFKVKKQKKQQKTSNLCGTIMVLQQESPHREGFLSRGSSTLILCVDGKIIAKIRLYLKWGREIHNANSKPHSAISKTKQTLCEKETARQYKSSRRDKQIFEHDNYSFLKNKNNKYEKTLHETLRF